MKHVDIEAICTQICAYTSPGDFLIYSNTVKYQVSVKHATVSILHYWVSALVHVCMYDRTYSKSMDQPGKVANPARGQLNREK